MISEFDRFLLWTGAWGGVYVDDSAPELLADCKAMARRGLMAPAEPIDDIQIFYTVARGIRLLGYTIH